MKTYYLFLSLILIATANLAFCDNKYGTVKDIEGNEYKTIKIGGQIWMGENLTTTKYNDGTDIPNVTSRREWRNLESGAYVWYDNDSNNGEIYGALYNWFTVETGKLCPTGWHVPSNKEWDQLRSFLIEDGHRDTESIALKSTSGWHNEGNGTDDYGFAAKPAGYRYINGIFLNIGNYGAWWSTTKGTEHSVWNRTIYYDRDSIRKYGLNKKIGLSVRCIKD